MMDRKHKTSCPCHRSWTRKYINSRLDKLIAMEARLDPEWAYIVRRLEGLW